jgi:hypothetical protein
MTSLRHIGFDIRLFNVACSREQMLVPQTVLNSFRKFKIVQGRYMKVYKVFWWRFADLWKLCRSSKAAKVQVDFFKEKRTWPAKQFVYRTTIAKPSYVFIKP